MKRNAFAFAAASALVLTGCAGTGTGPRSAAATTSPDPLNPQVSVVVGATAPYIVVDQEPIVVTTKGKSTITWTVVTKGYEFDKGKGIVINPKPLKGISGQLTGCKLVTPTQFACANNNNGKGIHSYDIYLVGPMGPLKVDPSFVND